MGIKSRALRPFCATKLCVYQVNTCSDKTFGKLLFIEMIVSVQIMPRDENTSNGDFISTKKHFLDLDKVLLPGTFWPWYKRGNFWGPTTSHFLASHPCVIMWHYRWWGGGVSFYRLTMIGIDSKMKLLNPLSLLPPPLNNRGSFQDHCVANTPLPAPKAVSISVCFLSHLENIVEMFSEAVVYFIF